MTIRHDNPLIEPVSGEAAGESSLILHDPAWRLRKLSGFATDLGATASAEEASAVADRVSEGRFYVACVGQFKRGKSTLLGALLGEQLLPTGFIPVTAVPTVIRYGNAKSARARLKGGEWRDISLGEVQFYVSEEHNPENAKGVEGVEIFTPSELLSKGMCLVDTPGLGSIFSGNSAATQAFIPHIDAAIVVLGADPPIAGEELALVESVGKQVQDLLIVINKADRTSDAERAAASRFTAKVLTQRLQRDVGPIFEVSAIEVLQEGRPTRDWERLLKSLITLIDISGRGLVRAAGERAINRVGEILLAIVIEEREALLRPIQETEERIVLTRQAIATSERSLHDLGYLLTAEQHRLSDLFLSQRKAFVNRVLPAVHAELADELKFIRHGTGPMFRREAMRKAQEITKKHVLPWLQQEQERAGHEYEDAVARFVDTGNDYLRRLSETGLPQLARMPNAIDIEAGLRAKSHFSFYDFIHLARPASPLRLLADLFLGVVRAYGPLERDAHNFLDHLLETNSSRVQSDVQERVQESRGQLEAQIRRLLLEVNRIAESALEHARTTVAAGAPAVAAELSKLIDMETELRRLVDTMQPLSPVSRASTGQHSNLADRQD
jgi:hypothetical protein